MIDLLVFVFVVVGALWLAFWLAVYAIGYGLYGLMTLAHNIRCVLRWLRNAWRARGGAVGAQGPRPVGDDEHDPDIPPVWWLGSVKEWREQFLG